MFKRKLRKSIASIAAGATVLMTVNAFALLPTIAQAAAGDLVKSADSGTVYVVLADGESICSLTSEGHYDMWAQYKAKGVARWKDVFTVDTSTYTDSGVCSLRVGSLVRTAANPEVFVIQSGNTKRGFDAWATFVADGYGSGGVYFVTDAALAGYTTGDKITTATTAAEIREGQLVKYASSATVYYVAKEDATLVKREVANEDAYFSNFGINWNLVITIPDTETYTASASQITGADTAINRPVAIETTPEPVVGELRVSLAADSPVANYIPQGAEGQTLTIINITNNGTTPVDVTGLSTKRVGSNGNNSDFTRLYAVYGGQRISSLKSISSLDEASLTFSLADGNKLTIGAGDTISVTIAGIAGGSGANGHVSAISVTGVTATAGTIGGLPVTGAAMSIGGTTATAVQYQYQGSSTNINIGDENVEIGRVKVTNQSSSKDVTVSSLTLKNTPASGTAASAADLGAFSLYLSGETSALATATMDANKYVNFKLTTPVTIAKGGSNQKVFIVKTATVASGPSEVVKMVFNNDVDLGTVDSDGNRTANTDEGTTAASYTISGGSLTVATATDTPAASNILSATTGIDILRAKLTSNQGAVDITSLKVDLIGTLAPDPSKLKISIVNSAGKTIHTEDTSTVNVNATEATESENEFTDAINDLNGEYTLIVTIDTASASSGNVYAKVNSGDITATRQADDATITASGTATGKVMTIGTPTLTLSLSTTPGSKTRVKGEANIPFMGFDMKAANDSSTIDVTSIMLTLIGTNDADVAQTVNKEDVQSVKLMNSDGTVLYAEKPSTATGSSLATYTFNSSTFTKDFPNTKIGQQGLKVVAYANLNTSFTDTDITKLYFKIAATSSVTATDVKGNSATISGTPNSGGTVVVTAVDRGTLDVQAFTSDVKSAQILSNSTDIEIGRFKLTAERETVTVKQLDFTLTSGADDDIAKVTLYNVTTGKTLGTDTTIVSDKAVFTGLNTGDNALAIKPGSSNAQTLSVRIDTNSVADNLADSGTTIAVSLADLRTDLEADGTSNDVYAATVAVSGTNGVTLTATGDETTYTSGDYTAAQTTLTMVSTASFAVGNLLLLDEAGDGSYTAADDEFVLIESIPSATTVTVRRGVAGSTAKSIVDDNLDIAEFTQALAGNNMKLYANKIAVANVTVGTQTLKNTGSSFMDAFKFKITPNASGEQEAVLNSVTISILGQRGIGSTSATDWYIDNIRIKDGAGTVLSTSTTAMSASTETVTFSSLNNSITSTGETFTVQVKIAGTVNGGTTPDKMQLGINSLGAIGTTGDLDWDDTKSTAITWVDQDDTSVQGEMISE